LTGNPDFVVQDGGYVSGDNIVKSWSTSNDAGDRPAEEFAIALDDVFGLQGDAAAFDRMR